MSDELNEKFLQAKDEVTKLSKAPDNDVKLELYGLFKQSTEGDVKGDKPGMMDFVGRAKYESWKKHEGKSMDEAKQDYIAMVEKLKAEDAG